MKRILMFTDGACLGNPGPGGWCCILRFGKYERVLRGGERHTTNNRMEIQAVLEGLKTLKEPCQVELYSDSKYVLQAITEWLPTWKRNQWRTAAKKPVANQELFQTIDELLQPHQLHPHWVKGHSGHPENELCDQIAKSEAEKFR